MWNEIVDDKTLEEFMDIVSYFHDSCIKELKYVSGAYVDADLSMNPVNARRVLNVVIQCQFETNSMIDMQFEGLRCMKLFPTDDRYTCEILDSTMIFIENCIYWCDCGGLSGNELDSYEGTMICAEKLRWRSIDKCMGDKDFYVAVV